MVKRKTDPFHKAQFATVICCSCGWISAAAMGKGQRTQAIYDWHSHRDNCAPAAIARATEGE